MAHVAARYVGFEGSSGFVLLSTNRTNVVTVQMSFYVVSHLGFIFVSSRANFTAIKHALAICAHNSIHLRLNFFVQFQISDEF